MYFDLKNNNYKNPYYKEKSITEVDRKNLHDELLTEIRGHIIDDRMNNTSETNKEKIRSLFDVTMKN